MMTARRRLLLGLGAAGLTVMPGLVSAQTLLDQAKDALGGLTGGGSGGGAASGLTDAEIGGGLKEALRIGTESVVAQLGAADGFLGDPAIRIPLPGPLQSVQDTLRKVGLSSYADEVETKLNRAAEAAAPEAKDLFFQAIQDMTLDDVQGILNGPQDAATQYFQQAMSAPLGEKMSPIVDRTLNEVGAISAYDSMMGEYAALPLVPDVKADLNQHVVDKALDGIFHYVAEEEAAIRANPAKRTTELLQKVFGS